MIAEGGDDQGGRGARDLQFDGAIDPGLQGAVRIGNVDLGQQGPRSRQQGVGDPRHLAVEGEVWHRGYANDGLDPGLDAKRVVLRRIDPDPDHIALGQRKHRGAAARVGRDQAADIDVALRDHAVEWSNHLLIDLLLVVKAQLCLRRRGIVVICICRVALGL
jgi:hypothetical protein